MHVFALVRVLVTYALCRLLSSLTPPPPAATPPTLPTAAPRGLPAARVKSSARLPSVMDSALLLIAANEPCPQPQVPRHTKRQLGHDSESPQEERFGDFRPV